MGEYFYIINTDKKEYIRPHNLGYGSKEYEIIANSKGLLHYLIFHDWEGDSIVMAGDEYNNSKLNARVHNDEEYEEISSQVKERFNDYMNHETNYLVSSDNVYNTYKPDNHRINVIVQQEFGVSFYGDNGEETREYRKEDNERKVEQYYCKCGQQFDTKEEARQHLKTAETANNL